MLAKRPCNGSIIILNTKLYIPKIRSNAVLRTELIQRLNLGQDKKLTVVSAPAGYGKTTLLGEWVSQCDKPVAWISLDAGDNDPSGFMLYLISAIKGILPTLGDALIYMLQSPQPPQIQWVMSHLINEISGGVRSFVLILDDYHVIENQAINGGMAFLIENLPAEMQVLLISREVPELPLAKLRVRNQVNELGMADLCFNHEEVTAFLKRSMSLTLSDSEVTDLEKSTEGWAAGLQLAALSIQGHQDVKPLIQSFSGNHSFVMDYLLEEVLNRLPQRIQSFLLDTSILDRLCAPLCDAILSLEGEGSAGENYSILAYLETVNLFLIPLDHERKWYRYHHLFLDFLRGQLIHRLRMEGKNFESVQSSLHLKASDWFNANGYELDAFQHAALSKDIRRTLSVIKGEGLSLLYRGATIPILNWLQSLSTTTMDAYPSLWIMYASAVLLTGQTGGVEDKLLCAERAVKALGDEGDIQEILGNMAAIRASLAVTRHDVGEIIVHANFALSYVNPEHLSIRVTSIWALGYAYHLQRNLLAAQEAYQEAIVISEKIGHRAIAIMSRLGMGNILELNNDLSGAMSYYLSVTALKGHEGYPVTCDAYLGLARIACEWNDGEQAEHYLHKAFELASRIDYTDRMILCELTWARLKAMARDSKRVITSLEKARLLASQKQYAHRMNEVVDQQVAYYLSQNDLKSASNLVQSYDVPISRIRLYLKRDETLKALDEILRINQLFQERNWEQEMLKVLVLQALALQQKGDVEAAATCLFKAIQKAEPGGFTRLFLDEGRPMAKLLDLVIERGNSSAYLNKLKAEFMAEKLHTSLERAEQWSPMEPLSVRELEVLKLIAEGYSNQEISKTLFLALSTVKGYNQRLFSKLQVENRTEAVARGRVLGLL